MDVLKNEQSIIIEGGNMVENVDRTYKKKEDISKCDIEKILQLVKTIKYGSITLVIQDGVLIQIETSEKIRLR